MNWLTANVVSALFLFSATAFAGEIKACVIVIKDHRFDPAEFSVGIKPEYWKQLSTSVDKPLRDKTILDHFDKMGFPTGEINGRMQGFFHGTGHGLGLEIHEPPRLSPAFETLQAGQVVTVEPGLYYLDAGGIRIEDDVLVTERGCEPLSTFPKVFQLD